MEESGEKRKYTPQMAIERMKEMKESIEYTFAKRQLLVLKLFYFFGLSSLSLKVVYMPLYFKQVGLPASYAGILAGIPPFIRGGGAFFLGVMADKLNIRKSLFLISLVANMVIPLLCLIPRIEYPVCDVDFTEEPVTDPLGMPYEATDPDNEIKKLVLGSYLGMNNNVSFPITRSKVDVRVANKTLQAKEWPQVRHVAYFHRRLTRSAVRDLLTGQRDESLGIFELFRRTSGRRTIKPPNEHDKKKNEVQSKNVSHANNMASKKIPRKKTQQESHEAMMTIFTTLLVLLIIGEFLGGPLRSLADLAVLEALGGDKLNYGEVALWMQVGKILLAPLILVLIRSYPLHLCNVIKDDYEYSLYPLAAFIAISMIFGNSIRFNHEDYSSKMKSADNPDADKTLLDVIFTFKTFTILILSFFAGGLSAVHYTFIFWYLTDLSPEDSAMVIAVVIVLRDIVSSISYKMSGRTLGVLGPVNTLHVALLLYIISFLSYAVMKNPWFAIIPEIVQYIVFPLAYSSFVVYLGQNTPAHLNATVQGIYQCLYYGIGFGIGPIVAGFLFEHVGGAYTFLVFAAISFALLLFSLARHAMSSYLDRLKDTAYKPVPEPEDSDEEPVTREEADY